MRYNRFFLFQSWSWISLVVLASFIPRPRSFGRQMLQALLSVISRGDIDKQIHLLFYFMVLFLLTLAYLKARMRAVIFFLVILVSSAVEFLQPVITLGLRKADKVDCLYNFVGCCLGLVAALTCEYLFKNFKLQTI